MNKTTTIYDRLSEYFANASAEDVVAELQSKIQDYYLYLRTAGKLDRWERSYRYYYGCDDRGFSAQSIKRAGEQGELATMRVNHYRALSQNLLTLTTTNEPAYEIRSINTDYSSQTQTLIATSLLDYYLKEKGLKATIKQVAEYAVIFDEGFSYTPWDTTIGDELAADGNRIIKTGDIRYEAKAPIDVIRDPNGRSSQNQHWAIVRSWANKWNLAAENPDQADDILSSSTSRSEYQDSFLLNFNYSLTNTSSDLIEVYEFYHEKTSAVPEGRYVKFVGSTLLEDTTLEDLGYDCIPLQRMASAEQAFSIHGYSNTLDLLAIQEAIDQGYSTILSNQNAFGVQNVWMPPGGSIASREIPGGLQLIESEKKPEPLQLTQTSPEVFTFVNNLEQVMEKLSGINSTIRGDPGANLKSGSALALVAGQAAQLLSGFTDAYDSLFEEIGTFTFKLLQKNASTPRTVAIVGKFNASYLQNYTSDDISHVVKVVVDKGNYLTKTAAGRVELANALLQMGADGQPLIKNAQEYVMVIQTGRLEPILEAPTAELLLIKSENEAIRAGRFTKAIRGDNHKLHIEEHRALLASPEARTNPELVAVVLAHIEEHEELEILEAQRQQQIQMRMQQPPVQQPNQAPGPANPAPAPVLPANPVNEAQQARMPTNPLTGEQYQPIV